MMNVVHGQEDDPLAVLNSFKAALVVNFSDLPKETKIEIEKEVKQLKPRCPNCLSKHCRYRYLNNKNRSKSIQPRFQCRSCHSQFTLGGKKYNSELFSGSSLQQNAHSMEKIEGKVNESFVQVPKEPVFENIHGIKQKNDQGLEVHEDNKFNAEITDSLYHQANNFYTPLDQDNIFMPNIACAQMGTTNLQSPSEQLFVNGNGDYENQLSIANEIMRRNRLSIANEMMGRNQLSIANDMMGRNQFFEGASYSIGMAEQRSRNNSYSSLPWNTHIPSLGKNCMHNCLGCSCLRPSLEIPIASEMGGWHGDGQELSKTNGFTS